MSLKYVASALALVGCLQAQAEMVDLDFSGTVLMPGGSAIAQGTGVTGHAVLNIGAYSEALVTQESVAGDPVYAAYGITGIRHVEFAASSANTLDVLVGSQRMRAIDPLVRISEFVRQDGSVSSNTVFLETRTWSAAQGNALVPMSLQLSSVPTSQALHAYMLEGLVGFGSLGVGAVDAAQGYVAPVGFTFEILQASVLASPVPEPASASLWAVGGILLMAGVRRRRAQLASVT